MAHDRRKADHIRINLEENVQFPSLTNGFGCYRLTHQALPELDLAEIETGVSFLGKRLHVPLLISSMTGGTEAARVLNHNLARGAQACGAAMGLGSQRAGIEQAETADTFRVRDLAPDILLFANLGAIQLNYGYTVDQCRRVVEMIEADALILHLNALQEAVQPEGDTRSKGGLKAIERMSSALPVMAKETGAGMSRGVALRLKRAGVRGIDVGGLGGTSFSAVEYYRARSAGDSTRANIGETFWDWGVPTPVSVVLSSVGLPTVATGGVRSGLDVARAISIGASAAGLAGRLLPAALEGEDALTAEVGTIIQELKAAMFLVGAKDIEALSAANALVTGRSREWLDNVME